ncbi:DUF2948 family protein [Aestuariivirga sp.]|uniref:DUF2948 family protein n=1 Tax=Aestuariivirga sp. TaxID=2650926 RepID=UPI0035946581
MLKLSALDTEDLAVISTHMQDAVLVVGDMGYSPKRKQFALLANRFAWDEAEIRQRRRTGLHFDRVLAVKTLNIPMTEKDAVLSLLAVSFAEIDAPAGEVLLTFSGGATVRLIVECLECQMADLGPAWSTENVPQHEIDDADSL